MADNEFAEEEVLDFDEEQEQQVNILRLGDGGSSISSCQVFPAPVGLSWDA